MSDLEQLVLIVWTLTIIGWGIGKFWEVW